MKRRLVRILINGLTLLSLLLCVATCVLWVRSYRPAASGAALDTFDITRSEPLYWVTFDPGRLTLARQVGKDWAGPTPAFRIMELEFAGSWVGNSSLWNLIIPYWMLAFVTTVAPAAWTAVAIRRLRSVRGRRSGQCPACDYDLRATPDRCPECGAVPAANGIA